ncbi:hypothetical protein [Azospirillum sp.]|uniref:hypothetical protein n=1 Tax=Azospirillum sp. TaxID=34012 RepID=UPI002D631459|nr:hypothetical protein [Azospirillum sp.]HYF86185.1 hypothetical protein [Azospirillum sp.]
MSGDLDLFKVMKEALAEGEEFDRQMMSAGWTMTRDIRLRAFLQLSAERLPEGSRFFIRDGNFFRGGELVHRQHSMPIVVTKCDNVWLPPIPEIVSDIWDEVAALARAQPQAFQAAVQGILDVDLAFETYPL